MKKVIKFTGREEEMTFEEVAEQFKYFVKGQVNKYKNVPNLYFEDLDSLGMLGLWKAFKGYDGSANFTTYATYFVRGEILRGFRKNIKITRENNYIKGVDSLDETIRSEGKDRTLYELNGNFDKNIELVPEKIFIEEFTKDFREEDRLIFNYILYKYPCQAKLAKKLGVTQVTVSRKAKKMLSNIRKEYLLQGAM